MTPFSGNSRTLIMSAVRQAILGLVLLSVAVRAQYDCFPAGATGTQALRTAVSDYVAGGTTSKLLYGPVIGNWCVDNVTSFMGVFQSLTKFNEPLTNWRTSSATNMAQMFQDAYAFNQSIAHFDVSRVTTMDRMFLRAYAFLGVGLDSWNTSSVQSLYFTFKKSGFNSPIPSWDVSSVTDLRDTFRESPLNQNLCPWGSKLSASKLGGRFTFTFDLTNCPVKSNINFALSPPGPLCYNCTNVPPTPKPTKPPTKNPTKAPTKKPTTSAPTKKPTATPTKAPTKAPAKAPTSSAPTRPPTRPPTRTPTRTPTRAPTKKPTIPPTRAPTQIPTETPTKAPTKKPTTAPPTHHPTKAPITKSPTWIPTKAPAKATSSPTKAPTRIPTRVPTRTPTLLTPTVNITDTWINVNESENYVARHECSFIQAGNKFYLFGGRENATRLDRYDYTTNTWDAGATVPEEVNHFQALTYQGLIWVMGAFGDNVFPKEAPSNYTYIYDPAHDVWIAGPPMPETRRRGSAALVAYNDQLYLAGGITNGHKSGTIPWLDRYDPRTGSWVQLADAPNARDHFAGVVVGSKLYCIGGRFTDTPNVYDKTIPMIDVYDFPTSSWTTIPNLTISEPRAGAAAVYFGGKILLIGGESANRSTAWERVDAFDPVTETLAQVASLNNRRQGTQAFVSGPGVIITDGSPNRGGGNQRNMEAYSRFAPEGVASTAGVLVGPSSVLVTVGQSVAISLVHASGNTGIIVSSLSFQGLDAANFTFSSMPTLPFLIGVGETRLLSIRYFGTKYSAAATLVVSYSGVSALGVPLQGFNPSSTPPPTHASTKKPTSAPTRLPTKTPTKAPTRRPTLAPSKQTTKSPTRSPTKLPTGKPTQVPTRAPTRPPSQKPTTRRPTKNPTREPTKNPTRAPTKNPTRAPTKNPTLAPTKSPTRIPTTSPTRIPTKSPTRIPTRIPTPMPTTPPTPVSRFGTSCFPADGVALRQSRNVSWFQA